MIEETRPDPNAPERTPGAGHTPEPAAPRPAAPPETTEHPVPGVKHEPEPDAGNIMPAEDEPGTF